jgi:hypothetical protein
VNRAELQQMTKERLKDAKALLDAERWEFAYYVAGYAVECALKSSLLARMVHTAWVFQEKWKAQDCLTHDVGDLVNLAGLTKELNSMLAANPAFVAYWGIVSQWTVTSRYQAKTETEARNLYDAITHDPDGVLKWIQKFW